MEELGALYSIIILRNGTGQPGGAACAMCTMDKKKMSVSHVRNLLYQFKKRETNGDGSNKHTTAVAFCQICCISRVPFSLGASFLLARGGTQRVPANPPPAAGFDNPTGAIVAPKAKRTLRYVLRKRREGDSHWAGTLKRLPTACCPVTVTAGLQNLGRTLGRLLSTVEGNHAHLHCH